MVNKYLFLHVFLKSMEPMRKGKRFIDILYILKLIDNFYTLEDTAKLAKLHRDKE